MKICPYCDDGIYPEDERVYCCGTLVGATAPETGLCHSGYEQKLKALVREMGEVVQAVAYNRCCTFGSQGSGVMLHHQGPKARAMLDCPEVKSIMISPQPSDPNTCCGEGFILSEDRTHWTCDQCGREYPMLLTTKVE